MSYIYMYKYIYKHTYQPDDHFNWLGNCGKIVIGKWGY